MLHHSMRRARVLGQYFTPESVVALCYRMLRTLDPDTGNPRIIDPACGEGAFLACALEQGITSPGNLYGIEKDPGFAASWEVRGLTSRANLLVGDGLCSSAHTGGRMTACPVFPSPCLPVVFDWVVGNPPFGVRCLKAASDFERMVRILRESFTIWRRDGRDTVDPSSCPIEALFLERFWQLARPGGYVAIIIPDGVLANARLSHIREWLSQRASVKAVVSLPQRLFHSTGASSKTSILVFRKRPANHRGAGDAEGKHGANLAASPCPTVPPSCIFLASLESPAPIRDGIEHLAALFAKFVSAPSESAISCPPWHVFSVENPAPGERLDPAYHHPRYIENLRLLESLRNVVRFGELIEYTTYGQVGSREFSESGVRLLTPANLATTSDGFVTGMNIHSPERFVAPGSRNDPPRSRLRKGDLLLSNSGVGCIGRAAVFYSDEPCNISQHINLIRVKCIEPEYLAVYLQTRFARLQIAREKCGVGPYGINFDRIKSILVPVPPADTRRKVAEDYRRLSAQPEMIRALVERLEDAVVRRRES